MSSPEKQKYNIIKQCLTQIEQPSRLKRRFAFYNIMYIALSTASVLMAFPLLELTTDKEIWPFALIFFAGIPLGIALTGMSNFAHWSILKNFMDIEKMESELKEYENKRPTS